jgi:hypothetical protein
MASLPSCVSDDDAEPKVAEPSSVIFVFPSFS